MSAEMIHREPGLWEFVCACGARQEIGKAGTEDAPEDFVWEAMRARFGWASVDGDPMCPKCFVVDEDEAWALADDDNLLIKASNNDFEGVERIMAQFPVQVLWDLVWAADNIKSQAVHQLRHHGEDVSEVAA